MSEQVKDERFFNVLRAPHLSEKSVRLQEVNQYVFEVAPDADKALVKAAVEALFNVKVTGVNTIVSKGKTKRWKGQAYQRSDAKKAIVTLAEGEMIDITEGAKA